MRTFRRNSNRVDLEYVRLPLCVPKQTMPTYAQMTNFSPPSSTPLNAGYLEEILT